MPEARAARPQRRPLFPGRRYGLPRPSAPEPVAPPVGDRVHHITDPLQLPTDPGRTPVPDGDKQDQQPQPLPPQPTKPAPTPLRNR